MPTCCDPIFVLSSDTTDIPLSGASVDTVGDTTRICGLGVGGNRGIRLMASGAAYGMAQQMSNVDLSIEESELRLRFVGKDPGDNWWWPQLRVLIEMEIYNEGGLLQIYAEYGSIGATSTLVEVYNGDDLAGSFEVPQVGLVAVAQDAGSGLPELSSWNMSMMPPEVCVFKFDRVISFELSDGPVYEGDGIRMTPMNPTYTTVGLDRLHLTGRNFGCIGMFNIDRANCCRGLVGNADGDPLDVLDGIDLSYMLDMLFISLEPVPCLVEADMDFSGNGHPNPEDIDGIDLSTMLDALFISLADPLPCP